MHYIASISVTGFCRLWIFECTRTPTPGWGQTSLCKGKSSTQSRIEFCYLIVYSTRRFDVHRWWFLTRMKQLYSGSMIISAMLDVDTAWWIIWKYILSFFGAEQRNYAPRIFGNNCLWQGRFSLKMGSRKIYLAKWRRKIWRILGRQRWKESQCI